MERECPGASKINEIITSGKTVGALSEVRGWVESPKHTKEMYDFLVEYDSLIKGQKNKDVLNSVSKRAGANENYEQIIKMDGKEAAYYMFMFIYQKLSKRGLKELDNEGVLLPAGLIYKSIVIGDDIFDESLEEGRGLSAGEAFNRQNRTDVSKSPKDLYDLGIGLVSKNKDLLFCRSINHTLGRLVLARGSYIESESEIEQLSRRGRCDLNDMIRLRYESFGKMAQALTELLNGKRGYIRQDAIKIEMQMFWVAMAQGMIDNRFDRAEDGRCGYKTPVILADEMDKKEGRKKGTTAGRIERYFLDQIDNPEVEGILLSFGRVTPVIERFFSKLG